MLCVWFATINIYDHSAILPFVFIAIMTVIYYFPAAWYLTKYNPW